MSNDRKPFPKYKKIIIPRLQPTASKHSSSTLDHFVKEMSADLWEAVISCSRGDLFIFK